MAAVPKRPCSDLEKRPDGKARTSLSSRSVTPGASRPNSMANLKSPSARAVKSHAISSLSASRSPAPSIWTQHVFFVTRIVGHPLIQIQARSVPVADCLGSLCRGLHRSAISRDGAPQQQLRRNGDTLLRLPRFLGLYMPLTSRNIVPHREGLLARALILIR